MWQMGVNMESTARIKEIMETLTVQEKVRLLSGVGSWHTYDCNGKIPSIMMTDGPHGLRKQEDNEDYSDINKSVVATCFPTASAIASSWNVEAIGKMARTIAKEALKEKVSIVLGCGTNIKRSPLCGRNFEYFSEDPFLSGVMATEYIKEVQALGVGTSLKHFAGNSQETRRQTSNSQIDERALREIYLSAFEMAVKEAQPTTIMASYNRLNGKYACENKELLTDILREEWGFKGAVISDWGAAIDVVSCIKAGMDLEMPDNFGIHTKQFLGAIEDGRITLTEIDRAVEQVLSLVLLQSEKLVDATVDYDEHHEIARNLACESAVLLKNDGMLPIEKQQTVLVVGELAELMRFQGGGSSHITTAKTPNAITSLQEKGVKVLYAKGYHSDGDRVDEELEQEALELARQEIPILFFGGLTESFEGEGYDRNTLSIPKCQLVLLEKLQKVNSNLAFISFGGSPMEMPFEKEVRAILHMYLGGQAVGEACADLITGDVNPSGKLAETFPVSLADVPCKDYFGQETEDVEYRESIFVGYRYYDTYKKPVLFEFGHGLSYTTFTYQDIKIDKERTRDGKVQVSFTITNSGQRKGSEIAQVYVKNPSCNYLRPERELRGFCKVCLEAGESKEVTVNLNERSFAIYDVKKHDFIMPSGTYEIQVGASLNDIRLQKSIEVEGVEVTRDDRQSLKEYFECQSEKGLSISKEQFEHLYGKPLSNFNQVKKGQYTLYHAFGRVARQSLLGRITFFFVKRMLYGMNKGKSKDDPSMMMLMRGVEEGTMDGLLCASRGAFPIGLAKMVVKAANGFKREEQHE